MPSDEKRQVILNGFLFDLADDYESFFECALPGRPKVEVIKGTALSADYRTVKEFYSALLTQHSGVCVMEFILGEHRVMIPEGFIQSISESEFHQGLYEIKFVGKKYLA